MSIRLEKTLPGFGFVRKSTGLTAPHEFEEFVGVLLGACRSKPQLVRCWIGGELDALAILNAARCETLSQLIPDARVLAPLPEAFERAWGLSRGGQETLKRYRTCVKKLLRLEPQLRLVRDLEKADWDGIAESWPGSNSDYMAMYRMLSTFLTLHFGGKRTGRAHPWRALVLDKLPRKAEQSRTPNITPALFRAIVAHVPEHVAPALWLLVLTGLRRGEYFRLGRAHLRPDTFEIVVPGTKTDGSSATLPVAPSAWHYIEAAVPAPVQYKALMAHWKAACLKEKKDFWLHDLRHAAGQWAVNGGMAEAAVQGYLRHEDASTTRRYTLQNARQEVAIAIAAAVGVAA
jgi:integrase